ncbi:MAG TPA: 50S ribosomal protein L29 [Patescibacteria group bacterium]|nr:50S ribosomal protein L29 [Patescibacteria group bacterium]
MKINFKEILSKNEAQLRKDIEEFHDQLHELRQKAALGELKTFHKIDQLRKLIAKHMTAIKQKMS